MSGPMGFDSIQKQIEKSVETIQPENSVFGQANKENEKSAKKQNRFANWIQVLTLIVSVLTLLATIWFGQQGS